MRIRAPCMDRGLYLDSYMNIKSMISTTSLKN